MKRQKKRIFGASLLLSAALLMGMASTPMAASESGDNQQGGPVVQTAEGPVRGFANTGVYEFKGIPYAAPPTGELRWRPPQPVAGSAGCNIVRQYLPAGDDTRCVCLSGQHYRRLPLS